MSLRRAFGLPAGQLGVSAAALMDRYCQALMGAGMYIVSIAQDSRLSFRDEIASIHAKLKVNIIS